MKKVIGITGGIASGKSSVVDYLIKNKYLVIDADKIAYDITMNNENVKESIRREFGSVYFKNNVLDRKSLGELIFSNKEKKEVLNNICHPVIKDIIKKEIELSNEEVIFIDVPLLYEANFLDLCDYVIVVYVDYDIQIKRLMSRDKISKEYAINKINSQMPLIKKVELCDFVINNNGCYEKLILNTKKVLEVIFNGKNLSNK